jgi:hypothetical protein
LGRGNGIGPKGNDLYRFLEGFLEFLDDNTSDTPALTINNTNIHVVIAASQANFRQDPYYGSPCGNLNRESERIPRSLTSTSSAESLRG